MIARSLPDFQRQYDYIERVAVRVAMAERLLKRIERNETAAVMLERPLYLRLGDLISDAFSEEELDALAFRLGVNPEHVDGDTMLTRPYHLVAHCKRSRMLDRLIDECERLRPLVKWR